ncbi:hypothetical protein [Hymenobacter cellulosilyticus]|uniref:hypothetical protein n=1 Tax=Hymenobacter cellulosilyticus TaxID=2932248 RepID=UPI0028808385|nr:hypothetical protein [Hymenobacter cellulosilyticus]
MSAVPKFAASRSFHTELKNRINAYFEESGMEPTGTTSLFVKAIILTTIFVALYIHVVFFTPSTLLALIECALMGL